MNSLESELFMKIRRHSTFLIKLLPLIAFVIPLVLLYWLDLPDPYLGPSSQFSFQLMWKGRTFELFFIWLIALEFILSWENIKLKINRQKKSGLAAVALALVLPSLYVIWEYYFGLNWTIANASKQIGVPFALSMPLAIEYLVFSVLFCIIVFSFFGKKGLTGFALPALFVCLVGVIYAIDNLFPYGQFTPFQLLVPTTATLAAFVLGLMGYAVLPGTENGMPTLQVTGSLGTAKFAIAWPCAGIESLLIFTAVSLLFLQRMHLSWKAKVGYFAIGAAVTYFINVLRIATIFTIGAQYGIDSSQVQIFHYYYGPIYAIIWIVSFPLIIIVSQSLLGRLRRKKLLERERATKPQSTQPSPV
jgi:thaumarchaeosortase